MFLVFFVFFWANVSAGRPTSLPGGRRSYNPDADGHCAQTIESKLYMLTYQTLF